MSARRAIVLASCLAILSCNGSGDLPLDQVDPDAVAADPTYDQVYAILRNNCVTCHTGEDEDEDDGGNGGYVLSRPRTTTGDTEPDLSDCVQIVGFRTDILVQVEENTMPPGAMPRLSSEQKLIIRRWIEDGAPAPCN
jgi:uncharacterized membrane protein